MRFSPPPSVRLSSDVSGMNQVVARSLNERLILSLLLQNSGMTRLELGKASGLSAQTISVIVRSLEADDLIVKGNAVRGRVGPPSRPVTLNPDGAFSIGLNLNCRQIAATMLNLAGQQVGFATAEVISWARSDIQHLVSGLISNLLAQSRPADRNRLIGIGLTLPREKARSAVPEELVRQADLEHYIEDKFDQDVHIQEEMTALVGAETMFGATRQIADHLECFVDTCVHMRLCLGGRIYAGSIAREFVHDMVQVNEEASEDWLEQAAQELRTQSKTLQSFIDTRTVVIASAFPHETTKRLVERLRDDLKKDLDAGPDVIPSQFGPFALCVGAAALPFHVKFVSDPE